MGCIVIGPGSRRREYRYQPAGTGKRRRPVYIDGQKDVTLEGTYDELAAASGAGRYITYAKKYPRKTASVPRRAQNPVAF